MNKMWLEVLRDEIKRTSLQKVADKTGLSRTTLSQASNEKYPGDLERVKTVIESAFMGATVVCPILGEIPVHVCQLHQKTQAGDVGDNPQSIKLYKACRSRCPNSQIDEIEQLKQPIRLYIPDANESKPALAQYDVATVIRRLERQANSDYDITDAAQKILNDLLKAELEAMAVKYNRLIKQTQRGDK